MLGSAKDYQEKIAANKAWLLLGPYKEDSKSHPHGKSVYA